MQPVLVVGSGRDVMLRALVAAADEDVRSVPHLRYAAEVQLAGPSPNGDTTARQAAQPTDPKQLRMVMRPGSQPTTVPGSPGQTSKVPVAASSPRNAQLSSAGPASRTAGSAGGDERVLSTVGAGAVVPAVIAEADKAYELTARANKLIAGGLHNCPDWAEVRDLYFAAAAHFQTADLHIEAGEAFSNAAAISRVYGSELEVANAAGYAVDSFRLADPMKAVTLLQEIMDIHHAGGRPKLEAKAAKDIAEIFEMIGELQLALEHYKRATALFAKQEITRNFRLKCLEKVARISGELRLYRDAVAYFEELVDLATRGTRVTDRYLYAMICMLADAEGDRQAGVLAKAKVTFDRYQDFDQFLQKGVENRLIKGVIEAFDKASLSAFDATQKAFFEFREKDPWVVLQLNRIRENLFQYLLPYM
jgi:tetratricopeptide (TPR) repeat protein